MCLTNATYLIIIHVLLNNTNDKQHKFSWVFLQVRGNCLTNHRPQAKFFTSETNRIGFPAFSDAAARQNERSLLSQKKCKSIQSVTNYSVIFEQK